MNILAFDTSSSACSVALYYESVHTDGKTLALHEHAPMQHTSIVLPMIQSLLDQAGLTMAELDAIAFGCGPGSFTGIRIAASIAQGLAYANSLPVIPVSSLAAAAQAAYIKHGWNWLLTAVDARMGQIYWAGYQVKVKLVSNVIPEILTEPLAVQAVTDEPWSAVGDGWRAYRHDLIERIGKQPEQFDEDCVATAEAVLHLAKDRFERGDWFEAHEALPVYLR